MAVFRVRFKIKTKTGIKWYRTVVEANSQSWAKYVAHQEVAKEYTIVLGTTVCVRFKR